VTRHCENYGKEFQAHISNVKRGNGRYCSKSCATTSRAIAKGYNVGLSSTDRLRKWREKYPEHYKDSQRNHHLKYTYGLSASEFDTMYTAQQGKCALCHKEFTGKEDAHVDHNHVTGKVRSLLHSGCNVGLRYVENAEFLAACVAYLDMHKQ
jgi:hypothetical protein